MRPILCVIDLSESTVKVLEVAARMAYAYKSHLTILFPYRLINTPYTGEISTLKKKLEQEAKERFQSLEKHVSVLHLISYDFQPEIGFTIDRINSFVKRNEVDSVVIGQHQSDIINEVNPGAFQNLIKTTKLPFTIVPEETDANIYTA